VLKDAQILTFVDLPWPCGDGEEQLCSRLVKQFAPDGASKIELFEPSRSVGKMVAALPGMFRRTRGKELSGSIVLL